MLSICAVSVAGAVSQNGLPDASYAGKLLRVRSTLCRIKENTDKAAVQFLSRMLDKQSTDTGIEITIFLKWSRSPSIENGGKRDLRANSVVTS
jgi:hypothetical protein